MFFNECGNIFIEFYFIEFSAAITPVFSVTWSFQIILICWFGDFFLSIYLENRCAAKYSNFQDSLKHKFSAISNVFIQNLNLNECMN